MGCQNHLDSVIINIIYYFNCLSHVHASIKYFFKNLFFCWDICFINSYLYWKFMLHQSFTYKFANTEKYILLTRILLEYKALYFAKLWIKKNGKLEHITHFFNGYQNVCAMKILSLFCFASDQNVSTLLHESRHVIAL